MLVGCSPLILGAIGMVQEIPRWVRTHEYYTSPAYKAELAERKATAKAIHDVKEYKAARLHDAADELNRRADDILR